MLSTNGHVYRVPPNKLHGSELRISCKMAGFFVTLNSLLHGTVIILLEQRSTLFVKQYAKDEEQEVLERTHPPLVLFNNAVINLNHLVQRFIRWDTETNRNSNSLLKHDIAKITEFYTEWFSVCPNINILHHRHF
jgi:hypothetical protein